MKIIRYLDSRGTIKYGARQPEGGALEIRGDLYSGRELTKTPADLQQLLAPVTPTAFICIGLNYRQHAVETGSPIPENPVVFFKSPGAVQHPWKPVIIPSQFITSTEVDFECELAVVIGKTCLNATRANALSHVLGYTCANDISARDWQAKWGGSQWCRGKTFDTFGPLGPCLVTTDEIPDPNTLRIRTLLNEKTMQDSNTSDMIFDVPALIQFLSSSTTLLPGTVILTGTPQGVGVARKPQVFLKAGDVVTVEIEKIGALTNPVQCETKSK